MNFFILSIILTFAICGPTNADSIDDCIQNKLRLQTSVNHKTLLQDFEKTDQLRKLRYAARSALQICHPTFDIVAGQIFKRLTKPDVLPSENEVKCFKVQLLKKEAKGSIVTHFDRNLLLHGFEDDNLCDDVISNFIQKQINSKMPEGNKVDLDCMHSIIDTYMNSRYKAMVLSHEHFEKEIYDEEKLIFVKELRDASQKLIECIVENN